MTAAMARVSGTVDTVRPTAEKATQQVLEEVSQLAIERAVENGALRSTIELAEIDVIPIQYVANKARFIVKAIGDFDFSRPPPAALDDPEFNNQYTTSRPLDKRPASYPSPPPPPTLSELEFYRPNVTAAREWIISERDLEWISTGCYIIGSGGGGSPYAEFVRVRELLRKGSVIRVISVDDIPDDARVGSGCGMGAPMVVIEKLAGDQCVHPGPTPIPLR